MSSLLLTLINFEQGSTVDLTPFFDPIFLGYLTPEDVHYGRAEQIIKEREKVLKMAFEKHPNRFKGKVPKPMALPKAVWINKPSPNESDSVIH